MTQSLRTGDSLSRFRIVAPIGAGGMGEVYKAIDDSLDRPIALKILPPDLVKNDERVRRFVQEAKSASSLSHPHIVHIYEIGNADVSGDDIVPGQKSLHYIAMELIDGHTLKREIHDEHTDLRALVGYLAQAADGLAKAHAAGIVHRDLKPENIMITKDGFAKVLDFGLAKLTEKREATGESSAATAVRERTREGAVMGTVGYMSPEQVQGKPVDFRSDIFSFGCILYEAATRRKAFEADSDVDVMHRILHDKPQPIDEIDAGVPAELRRIIRRCLAKAPEKRYQSMKDVAIELGEVADEWEELSSSSSSTSSGSGTSAALASVAPPRSRRITQALLALTVAVVALLSFFIYRSFHSPSPAADVPQAFESMKIAPLTGSGDVTRMAISPDGKYVANVRRNGAGFGLWVRQVATGSDVAVVPPSSLEIFAVNFSPDANYIYFVRREDVTAGYSTLLRVPTLGGTPQKVLFDIDSYLGFSPDAKRITFIRGNPPVHESYLMIANVDGTGIRKLSTLKQPLRFDNVAACWSPDGKIVAASQSGDIASQIVFFDAASGAPIGASSKRFWFPDGFGWLPDGSAILVTSGDPDSTTKNSQIWLIPFPDGAARRVTNDLNDYRGVSITSDGKVMATTQVRASSDLWLGNGKGETSREVSIGSNGFVHDLHVTGKSIYFSNVLISNPQIWASDLNGENLHAVVTDPAGAIGPDLPANEGFLMYESLRDSPRPRVWRAQPDGSDPHVLTNPVSMTFRRSFAVAPDGEWFLFVQFGSDRLMKEKFEAGSKAVDLGQVAGTFDIAPDSKSIAMMSWQPARGGQTLREISIIPAEGGKAILRLPLAGEDYRWSADGKSLSFIRNDQNVSNIYRQALDGSPPQPITHFTSGKIVSHDWTPQGSLVLARGTESSDVVLISDFH